MSVNNLSLAHLHAYKYYDEQVLTWFNLFRNGAAIYGYRLWFVIDISQGHMQIEVGDAWWAVVILGHQSDRVDPLFLPIQHTILTSFRGT